MYLCDYDVSSHNPQIVSRSADLNGRFPYDDDTFDAVVALEVIEHLENPRHFMREIVRILRPGGGCLISTPNCASLTSKACFLLRTQQQFQESCYPAHISAILPIDFQRLATEVGLAEQKIIYSNHGRIPGTTTRWQILLILKGKWFSDNLAISSRKSYVSR